MATVQEMLTQRDGRRESAISEAQYEQWVHWPVNWTAIWVGALASVAALLVFGLIGIAIGVNAVQPESRVVDLHKIAIGTLIFSVCAAFFAFVIGGWCAGKVAGILRAEPAILHGAVVWLLATPALVILAALGAGSYIGTWHASLAGTPTWASRPALPFERPDAPALNATAAERTAYLNEMATYRARVQQWNDETPKAVRNSALGAVTALLLGLVGSVLGGWMACGEPMSLTHFRTRKSPLMHRA
ncbi:MAG TPA: hypothetical protein VGP68_01320 [Gemmataceae bacterium]|jgi:hypothetical protein|nr:hypothetical protein [Gemmataceae bacterium]